MTCFVLLFGMREKLSCFESCLSLVLKQNEDIRNFHGSLTSNNEKLFDILEAIGMSLC